MRFDEYLQLEDEKIVCRKCGHVYCSKEENYKLYAREMVQHFTDVGLLNRPQHELMDRQVVFRQFFCPGCFTNIENETILADEGPIHDKQLT